uniref:F-box domain-containing protein n=1 Tax=Mesocestoides corti TaxID=53468 RepID=A0A5K3F318_MESCO
MPLRSDNQETQQHQHQCLTETLPRRSNSVSSLGSDVVPTRVARQKRLRLSGGVSSGTSVTSDIQNPPRKSRRYRSCADGVADNLADTETPPKVMCNPVFISDHPSSPVKCFSDHVDSDSNSCMEDLKTVVEVASVQEEVRVDDDMSGSPTSESNDEANNSETEDEPVIKLPSSTFQDSEPEANSTSRSSFCESVGVSHADTVQRSLSFTSTPSVQRSNSCDACSHPSTSSSALPSDAFRQQVDAPCPNTLLPKACLSSFSSAASLVSTVLEPVSSPPSPHEPTQQLQHRGELTGALPRVIGDSCCYLDPVVEITASDVVNVPEIANADQPPDERVQEKGEAKTNSDSQLSGSDVPKRGKRKREMHRLRNSSKKAMIESANGASLELHVYPLRSRIRQEQLRKQWEEMRNAPRKLDDLPVEVMLRIVQYLSIQDLFRAQRVNKRLRSVALMYLLQVKRVNFSNGLPFAFLSDCLDDAALRRILSRTPEVTHILGFYPRRIYAGGVQPALPSQNASGRTLTYAGIIDIFRSCSKLRSVELMDVELMSQLVLRLPHVKFHGMFRNRPDSWDSEYAIPMPSEPEAESSRNGPAVVDHHLQQRLSTSPYFSCVNSLLTNCNMGMTSSSSMDLAQAAAAFVNQAAVRGARLADWFEPINEAPLGQGSPSVHYSHFAPSPAQRVLIAAQPPPVSQPGLISQEPGPPAFADPDPMVALAIAAAFVPPENILGRLQLVDFHERVSTPALTRLADAVAAGSQRARRGRGSQQRRGQAPPPPPAPPQPGLPQVPLFLYQQQQYHHHHPDSGVQGLVSPLPSLRHPPPVILPPVISNLTKLDLVSVAISALPKLDNVKYLHLKWVVFTMSDPFGSFQANKLQSFVMNNCIGPQRFVRFVRIFAVLTRAPQLTRLELVGTRFIDGLIEHLVDREEPPAYCFRNLQRLVLAGNKDATEIDVGLLLVASQQSLSHLALQIWHTRNSLFEALSQAGVRLVRLESLILGYQDPYRARLTASELASLELVDSVESLVPVCNFTNRGLTLVFTVCPRLTSLTLRHAPFVTQFRFEATPSSVDSEQAVNNEETSGGGSAEGADEPRPIHHTCLPLRSLTLENCPNVGVEELERIISTGHPFGLLDSLILRDMFPLRREISPSSSNFMNEEPAVWSERWSAPSTPKDESPARPESRNWKKLGLLLSIADHLSARRIAFAPLAPTGVALGSSARDVTHVATVGMRLLNLPVKPFDTFFTLRTHTYLSSLLHLDGSCGHSSGRPTASRISRLIFDTEALTTQNTTFTDNNDADDTTCADVADFVSRCTQTCVCGLLEWDFVQRMHLLPSKQTPRHASTSEPARALPWEHGLHAPHAQLPQQQQLGGPLAFHPFAPSQQHQVLYQQMTNSEWARGVVASPAFAHLRDTQAPFVRPLCGPGECPGCASGVENPPSATRAESDLKHAPRVWIARDACVDTSELRCFTGPKPCVLTLWQPVVSPFSCLTTLHFEKVGISHLVLSGVPRLKNITLENCPALAAILVHPVESAVAPCVRDPVPCLRRVRILRCPKFAIYHWLYTAAKLYPHHDDNLFITFRPFGQYNEEVESALWNHAHTVHVMVSHDYSRDKSERAMEESHSALDQRFREVMNFSDALLRRDLPPCLNSAGANDRVPLIRTEYGPDWDYSTDISWINSAMLNPQMEPSLSSNAQLSLPVVSTGPLPPTTSDNICQIYCFMREYQNYFKYCRRGIHLHVQYRDVHGEETVTGSPECSDNDANCDIDSSARDDDDDDREPAPSTSYLHWPYTENYLHAVHPADDLNVWGDGFNESLTSVLPPHIPLPREAPVVSPALGQALLTIPRKWRKRSLSDTSSPAGLRNPKRPRNVK